MLELLFQDYWPYVVGVLVAVLAIYAIWSGARESTEDSRRYAKLKDSLFRPVANDDVMRNARTPHSSVVGSIKIDGVSGVDLVLEGRDGFFILIPKEDRWHSIPWQRIDRISPESEKRLSVYVKRDGRPPIEVSIPWSGDMSLENWQEFSRRVE